MPCALLPTRLTFTTAASRAATTFLRLRRPIAVFISRATSAPPTPTSAASGRKQFAGGGGIVHHKDIKSTPLFGLGVGWQARHWLRFDLTGEYRGDGLFLAHDQFPGTNTNEYTADIRSWMGLVNAYIDMGNWCGFTPFIGAGIGFATLTVDGMKDVNVAQPAGSVAFGQTHTNTNFAYAFYAGGSFDITPQVALELTYRYADLGSAQSGRVTTYDGAASNSGVFIRDITSNDVMLGMRYKFQREAVVYQPVK